MCLMAGVSASESRAVLADSKTPVDLGSLAQLAREVAIQNGSKSCRHFGGSEVRKRTNSNLDVF